MAELLTLEQRLYIECDRLRAEFIAWTRQRALIEEEHEKSETVWRIAQVLMFAALIIAILWR